MSTIDKRIKFLSYAYHGACHDYSMLKTELPPERAIWFDEHHIQVDLGFLGIASDYEPPQLSIPFKKGRRQELTSKQKKKNRKLSSNLSTTSPLTTSQYPNLPTKNPSLLPDIAPASPAPVPKATNLPVTGPCPARCRRTAEKLLRYNPSEPTHPV